MAFSSRGVSENGTRYSTSPRARWFLVESRYGDDPDEFEAEELGGYDVSSSQTQILAVLLGLEKLERIARNLSFKNYLARRAWYVAHAGWLRLPHQRTPNGASEYKAADDARLVAFVKELWMRTLYGSPARTVVYESAQDQKQFGPKWTEA